MKNDAWYFAYGSNLHVEQMERRTGPIREARPCRLKDYRLAFNKRRTNGDVCANVVPEPTEEVWGVIYRCSADAFQALDGFEGVSTGHYDRVTVSVETEAAESLTAITYVAGAAHLCAESSPSDEYYRKIVQGAKDHRLPRSYIRSIEFRSGRRSCRDYERLWRGFYVDRGLHNNWLDLLNSLKAFELISICEGHPTEGRRTLRSMPHINLRMKAEFVAPIAERWSHLVFDIQTLSKREFSLDDTSATFKLCRCIPSHQNAVRADDDVVVHINARVAFDNGPKDELINDWFERSVTSIRKLDTVFCGIIAPQNTAQQAVDHYTGKDGDLGLM